jgi:hypothetical protein
MEAVPQTNRPFCLSSAFSLAAASFAVYLPSELQHGQPASKTEQVILMEPDFQRRFFDVLTVCIVSGKLEPTKCSGKVRCPSRCHTTFKQHMHFRSIQAGHIKCKESIVRYAMPALPALTCRLARQTQPPSDLTRRS